MSCNCSIKQEVAKYILLYCNNINNLYIAFSGGVDSCVLLDAISIVNKELNVNKKIIALHINHNISKNSVAWEKFCHDYCDNLNIKIYSHQVNLVVKKDQSLESVARTARYNVFKNYLNNQDKILITAHHQNDQAETLLLNLFRGSGLTGLTGMKIFADLDKKNNTKILRPLLDINKNLILDYAKKNNLTWVEDESNFCIDHSRNYLRHEIIPKLSEKWPAVVNKISHSAMHCFEAEKYINKNMAFHYTQSLSIDDFGYNVLNIEYLKQLLKEEQKYLLRYFISKQNASYPSKIKLEEILNQTLNARADANISVCWKYESNNYEIKRFKNKIYLLTNFKVNPDKKYNKYNYKLGDKLYIPEINKSLISYIKDNINTSESKNIEKHDDVKLEINFRKNINANKVLVKLKNNLCSISLKKYLQRINIPAWERDNIVLIFIEDKLIYIIIGSKIISCSEYINSYVFDLL
tara:strand:- start:11373 stop:12770 length:1398 start_codon:yes stop_codon:yes gene_type:complete